MLRIQPRVRGMVGNDLPRWGETPSSRPFTGRARTDRNSTRVEELILEDVRLSARMARETLAPPLS